MLGLLEEKEEEGDEAREHADADMFLKARHPHRVWFLVRTQCHSHGTVNINSLTHVREAETTRWQHHQGCHRGRGTTWGEERYVRRQRSNDRPCACSCTYGQPHNGQ